MKAAFFSFPPADGHGGRRHRRPLFITTTDTTASPLWRPSVCQPFANTWVCISGSGRTTSQRLMWLGFSVHSYDTCGGQSSSCGTTDESTRDRSWPNCGGTIPVSTLNRSPATLLNSIPLNRYGMTSRATPPTVCFKTSGISASDSTTMHGVCVARKPNSDRSSWPPTSHRRPGSGCITYAKRYNPDYSYPGSQRWKSSTNRSFQCWHRGQ